MARARIALYTGVIREGKTVQPVITREIQLGYRSVFQDGRISPSLLWEELEDTAELHCRMIGRDMFSLLSEGEAWVLKGARSEMYRYPGYGETFRIESRISSLERYRGYREFRITTPAGELLGEISTLWIYMDLEGRHLKAIPRAFHRGWGCSSAPGFPEAYVKEKFFGLEGYGITDIPVRRRDIDSSAHVHNVRYLEWLSEAVPLDVFSGSQIASFSILYKREMKRGGTVQIRSRDLGGGRYRHDYFGGGELLCSLHSAWKSKEELYAPVKTPVYKGAVVS